MKRGGEMGKMLILLLLGCFFFSCGGGGGGGTDGGVEIPIPPPTAAIQASATNIQQGQSVTISWQTTGGTVALNPAIAVNPAAVGSASDIPQATTTYTVTCTASDGQKATGSVTVNVTPIPIPPPTAAIQASATNIQQGQSVTISWQTTGGTANISGIGNNLSSSGSQNVSPSITTTYTVICTAMDGQIATASVTVNVTPIPIPPPTAAIQASATNIQQGQSVTISWQTTGGTVALNPAIAVNPAAVGSASDIPQATTTYTVTCTASDGQKATGSVTVNVTPIPIPPPTAAIQASATNIQQGQSVTISWQTTGGTVDVTNIGSNLDAIGSVSVIPQATTTYTVTCTASDGQIATGSVTVNVTPVTGGPPEVAYLEVSPERVLRPTTAGVITLSLKDPADIDKVEIAFTTGDFTPLAKTADYEWSVAVEATKLLQNYKSGEPQVFAGYLDTYKGATRITRYNLFFPVRTAAMPDVAIQNPGPNMQTSNHVLNIRHDTLFLGGTTSTFSTVWSAIYSTVQNTIGQPDFYALVGQVEAFANRTGGGSVLGFPNGNYFDLANRGAVHEIAHRWLASSNHPLLKDPQGGGHWALGNAAGGIIGWSLPNRVGVMFPYRLAPGSVPGTTQLWSEPFATQFNELELYKLGLIPKEQVSPILQFTDQARAVAWMTNPYSLPSCGAGCQVLDVPATYVSVDDMIATDGSTPPATQTGFTLGTVALSKGRLLTANEMAYFEYMATRGEGTAPVQVWEGFISYTGQPFSGASGGRTTLSTRIR